MTARALAFTYGSVAVGKDQADSNYALTGQYTFRETYQDVFISFDVVVSAATQLAFKTSALALENAYKVIDDTISVNLGGAASLNIRVAPGTISLASSSCFAGSPFT